METAVKGVSRGSGSEEKELQPIEKRPAKRPMNATGARVVNEMASIFFICAVMCVVIRGPSSWRSRFGPRPCQ